MVTLALLDEDGGEHEIRGDTRVVDAADLAAATGWELKPEGLCRGELCMPLLGRAVAAGGEPDRIDLGEWAAALRLPLAVDAEHGVAALAPAPDAGGGGLQVGDPAPELTLPDLDGNHVSFGQFSGRKRVLLTWASW
jgi:hypothetical protein